MKKFKPLLLVLFIIISTSLNAQKIVTEVYSDFDGWWRSSTDSISRVAPNNSHNLLGFKVEDKIYSTGVNNKLLRDHGLSYVPLLFRALPVNTVGAGGIIGLGSAITQPIVNDPVLYLTDGINGLDLCTAMFNWKGSNTYNISSVNPAAIGDSIPDIIIPQVGDPSGLYDKFRFVDSNGAIVGVERSVQFTGIPSVGKNDWKFYSRADPPKLGAASAGTRELRIIAYDYADLGITPDNYRNIAKFVHQLSGTSDQPFIAYNYSSFVVVYVELKDFQIQKSNEDVRLSWTTSSELNSNYFTIERSTDVSTWSTIARQNSKAKNGFCNTELNYLFTDTNPLPGKNYYRLKQASLDGHIEYSNTLSVNFNRQDANKLVFYPNPAKDVLEIKGLQTGNVITLLNMYGKVLQHRIVNNQEVLKIDISTYPSGFYVIKIFDHNGEPSRNFKFTKE